MGQFEVGRGTLSAFFYDDHGADDLFISEGPAAKRDCSADAAPWALASNEARTAAWWHEKAAVSWLAWFII